MRLFVGSVMVLLGAVAVALPMKTEGASPQRSTPKTDRVQPAYRIALVVDLTVNVDSGIRDRVTEGLREVLKTHYEVTVPPSLESSGPPCSAEPACVLDKLASTGSDAAIFFVMVRVGRELKLDPTWVSQTEVRPRTPLRLDLAGIDLVSQIRAQRSSLLGPEPTVPGIAPRAEAPAPLPLSEPTVRSAPEDAPSSVRWPTWVMGGVGVASLAAGVGLGIAARQQHDTLVADGCRQRVCTPSRIDRLSTLSVAADSLLVTSALSFGTAAALWFLLDEDPSQASRHRISLGTDGSGLIVQGRFE